MSAPPLMGYILDEFKAGEPHSKTTIILVDDLHFDIMDPSTWVFHVKTIARSLSNLCRFNGHLETFYSVAEHAVRVSKKLEEWGMTKTIQFLGLHHDDMESIIGDIPSPQKRLFYVDGEPISVLEKALEYSYFATFEYFACTMRDTGGRPPHASLFDETWDMVKRADLAVYLEERAERPNLGRGLPPQQAYEEYLALHNQLAGYIPLLVEEEPTPF